MLLILFLKEREQTNQMETRKKPKTLVTSELGDKDLSNLPKFSISEQTQTFQKRLYP